MAYFDPENFGMFTPEQVVQKAQERWGGFDTGFYTVSYQGLIQSGYSRYYRYAVYCFQTSEITMTGNVWSADINTANCVKTGVIPIALVSMGFLESDGRLLQYSGSGTVANLSVPLYQMSNGTLSPAPTYTWEQTNMYSTVKITNTTDSSYSYNPSSGTNNIRIGDETPSKIYVGNTAISKAYIGDTVLLE